MVEQIPGTQTGVTQSVLGSQLAPSAQGEHGMGLEGTWEQGLGRSMGTKRTSAAGASQRGQGDLPSTVLVSPQLSGSPGPERLPLCPHTLE